MVHAGRGEEAVVVVDVHAPAAERLLAHGVIVVEAVARADDLVCEADVVQHLAVVWPRRERAQVRVDRLRPCSIYIICKCTTALEEEGLTSVFPGLVASPILYTLELYWSTVQVVSLFPRSASRLARVTRNSLVRT